MYSFFTGTQQAAAQVFARYCATIDVAAIKQAESRLNAEDAELVQHTMDKVAPLLVSPVSLPWVSEVEALQERIRRTSLDLLYPENWNLFDLLVVAAFAGSIFGELMPDTDRRALVEPFYRLFPVSP